MTTFRIANENQTTTVDLLSSTMRLVAGSRTGRTPSAALDYRLGRFGAQPKFSHYNPVQERFQLFGLDSAANIRAYIDSIMDIVDRVRLWNEDDLFEESWWLEAYSTGESAKRALLYDIEAEFSATQTASDLLECGDLLTRIAAERHPFWENTSYTTISNTTDIWGGKWALTSIPGTAPARIQRALFDLGTATGTERIWCGIRDDYGYGSANFDPTIDLASATLFNNTAIVGSDPQTDLTAAPTTMAQRATIRMVTHAGGNYGEYLGEYLVLLRARVSAGTVAGVQLRWGIPGSTTTAEIIENTVIVDSTTWEIYELGEVKIPPTGVWEGYPADFIEDFLFQIYAERITASGGADTIEYDELCLIPSRHFVYAKDLETSAGAVPLTAITRANDTSLAFSQAGGAVAERKTFVGYTNRDWYFPAGDSVLVLAADRTTGDKTGNLDLQFRYYPRWHSFRT